MIGGRSSYSTDSLSVLRRGIEVAPENRVGFFSRSKRKRWSILSAKDARSPDGLRSRPLTNSSSFSNSSLDYLTTDSGETPIICARACQCRWCAACLHGLSESTAASQCIWLNPSKAWQFPLLVVRAAIFLARLWRRRSLPHAAMLALVCSFLNLQS